MEIELRKEICRVLKEQEKELKDYRRCQEVMSISELFSQIHPKNYERLVGSLHSLQNKDIGLLNVLKVQLSSSEKTQLYNHLKDVTIAQLANIDFTFFTDIVSNMSETRAIAFFNGDYGLDRHWGEMIFSTLGFPQLLRLISEFSEETFAFYLREDEEAFQEVFHLLCCENCEESKRKIFSKFATLPAEIVGSVLGKANTNVTYEILSYLDKEKLLEVYQNIESSYLMDAIDCSGYRVPLENEDFPLDRLQDDEKRRLFIVLRDREELKRFKLSQIALKFFGVLELEEKEYVLYEFTGKDKWAELYENLPKLEQMETLEILTGRNATGKYKVNLPDVGEFLEKRQSRTYFEELVLRDIQAQS